MRVILFQNQFEPMILNGRKRSTIRRRAHAKPGQPLSLRVWSGKPYRSKQRLLCEVNCTAVMSVTIARSGIIMNGLSLSGMAVEELARRDGFTSWSALLEWFNGVHGLPFSGEIIFWN